MALSSALGLSVWAAGLPMLVQLIWRCRRSAPVEIGQDVSVVVWEKVAYVEGPGGAFVIRAQPAGPPHQIATWSFLVVLGANVRQLLRRRQAWTVSVRRPEDDPWGPTVYVETFESKRDALDALEKVREVLRSREVPSFSAAE